MATPFRKALGGYVIFPRSLWHHPCFLHDPIPVTASQTELRVVMFPFAAHLLSGNGAVPSTAHLFLASRQHRLERTMTRPTMDAASSVPREEQQDVKIGKDRPPGCGGLPA